MRIYYEQNGNITLTAKVIGVNYKSVRRWINKDLWPYEHCKHQRTDHE